ncbi:alpha/beta-hydrolase [Patellaria atrata CBS 101060]|uniref:Alpha/beta-hydrolase n=1 Tax=Patellaria atrata CBS 101060 TaxID=1346257 RepID=A0A9P4SF34_9PEZI|nr:alpha/beta-hydrolase [Patellaria atrata CBS 101060]
MATNIAGENGDGEIAIQPYNMHVSARYLDLTKRKLELTRLPRELLLPEHRKWDYGTPKTTLEPLLDYWLEEYDWRAQESMFNETLPQYRTTITLNDFTLQSSPHPPLRVHFVHKRSSRPNSIPLLFCHGWPGSFTEVSKVINKLAEPINEPSMGSGPTLGFHVVCPSIPGFGFSDSSPHEGFGLKATADIFDALMRRLGYNEYVVHGAGWGFKISRMIALQHPENCLAVHTTSPELPPPKVKRSPLAFMKYHAARLTKARLQPLSFGYVPSEFQMNHNYEQSSDECLGSQYGQRPQTRAYSLCDSPIGLLASMLDAIQYTSNTYTWSATEILNWTMMHWLPGPEAGLRWLRAANREVGAECWDTYSHVPLGISHFRPVGTGSRVSTTPPTWASSIQNLQWIKRHQHEARRPAFDAPDELVVDLREFYQHAIDAHLVRFKPLDGS